MDDRTIAVLELPAVLERLASQTAFSAGREAALALRPSSEIEVVRARQQETAEAITLDRLGVTIPLAGAREVRDRADAAARGAVLTPAELLDIASLARAAMTARRVVLRQEEDAPRLARVAAGIGELGPLRTLIEEAIDDRGGVRDSASPELAQIRREAIAAHDRLKTRMEAIAGASGIRNALQDAIVVMRDGRYVLPVKADFRGAVRGVVHDTSASGATVYVEPLAVVELGNQWRELQVQERHEVERILRDLSTATGEQATDLHDAVERLAHLDVAQSKGRLAVALDATHLATQGPNQRWLVDAPAEYRLVEARHPLLHGPVVPTSIRVGGDFDALLITGPNTGGKTVALKTAGLLCLMALTGLPVPAGPGSQIPVYSAVFADIGDEQSIEQSLSTFSGHITAIIDIIERAQGGSLVLLDEMGAGTDPTEGAVLGIAIVERLVSQGAALIATTHHSELKVYAHQTPRVRNASVEFNLGTLRPTYRLTIGLPGQSNALAIASNLGMPADVIARARAGLSSETREMESLLGDLRAQLTTAEERAERAASDAAIAETLRTDLERQIRETRDDLTHVREEARQRARRQLRDVERLVDRTRREVESARLDQAKADLERVRGAVARVEPIPTREVEALPETRPEPMARGDLFVEAGTVVWLRGISQPGEALSDPSDDGEFEVQLGALRTRVRMEQVERTDVPDEAHRVVLGRMGVSAAPPTPVEIDMRGRTVDEALPLVDQFLDDAARSGRGRVRIIHGKGTGTLRRVLRDSLGKHPLVAKFETAPQPEGGEGVTIAYLEGA
ncbi:MAG: endonuclease MutS2 [Chloroflexi bacterium]|nr:MAG: endonuclease MutS2 [Chloroflexota bacterium]